jgi:hypothetical protein
MSAYKPYLTEKDTPSRKTRKSERNKVFQYNKTIARKLKKEAKNARS